MNERVGDIEMLNNKKRKGQKEEGKREREGQRDKDQLRLRRMTRERFLLTDDA